MAIGLGIDTQTIFISCFKGDDNHQPACPGTQKRLVRTRSLICFLAVQATHTTQAVLWRYFSLAQPAISMAVARGRKLAAEMKIAFSRLISQRTSLSIPLDTSRYTEKNIVDASVAFSGAA